MIEWIATAAALTIALTAALRLPFEIAKLKAEARKANAEAEALDEDDRFRPRPGASRGGLAQPAVTRRLRDSLGNR